MSLYDVPQQELVERVAVALQKVEQIKPPEWALFAKISSQNEKPPVRSDWWYVRAASVLRRIALLGPVGVSKLSIKFGGKKIEVTRHPDLRLQEEIIFAKFFNNLKKLDFASRIKKEVTKDELLPLKEWHFSIL